MTIPVGFNLIRKPIQFCSLQTKKQQRKGIITKNELLQKQLKICRENNIKYKYVLTDSWFSAKDNMEFIRLDLNKHFIMALKSNRTVALREEDKKQGHFTRIDELSLSEQKPILGWIKGVDFPVLLPTSSLYKQGW